ncbi:MAG: peptidase M42 [Flavobacteriales bacterium CG_4_9_14_0_2_um_filter_35_242]|nr:M42 family metallopeptidase [Zetaproteobacteria bacterium]OIO10528.1 MAG: peptidase M42 [Flavobacteriaceae bacterium CG1_02_35_72]PIX07553.1 MAG: peptidase M42 [Flavobacteriales bacterium CG_4_8_14_3_um_filter_35_10]PJA05076.1 MAG: peptidase M42 [Flavobacteriales bacterium CG_4_10_14_0_2_um_filter_35_18]PJC58253.1 MAG: peptidase M42 [Flavobacteriales bacterium CG_4_9_14_0_2_um_filter_35_242]
MKSILNPKSIQFLETYLNNPSPTGYECEGQKIWMNYLKPYVNNFITDNYGTAVGVINPEATFKVVIEGHADEISWYVNYITPEGLIYVIRNGGSDHQIAPAKRVNIHTKKGIVKGIFGWPAIHTRLKDKEEPAKLDNIFIDCGCENKAEVEALGIHVGCVITYPDEFMILNDNKFVCRALDNRMGGFIIAEVARLLHENKKTLPFGLYLTNSVQEEIGLRGAQMITHTIKPNLAIVTDVCHDTTTPMIDKKKEGETKCGDGPVITYAPAVQNNVRELIIETAIKHEIPFQRSASSSSTGTDTDAFAYSNGGVPSALISLALRYMHTTVEMVDKRDVENVIKLIYNTLLAIDPNKSFSYFK